MAERRADDRPFPPGDYPIVVVGSGPGRRSRSPTSSAGSGIEHALLSRDPAPGRHVPPLAVLPAAPVVDEAVCARRARRPRAYERYDWNSLLAEEPELRAIQAEFMDGSSYFPSRPEMEANLAAFAERAGVAGPLRLRLEVDAARGEPRTATRFVLETTDGEYRAGS